MKPTLKAPATKRLKLQYDVPPSNFGFKFKWCRYTTLENPPAVLLRTLVGRCRLTLSNPR